MQVGQTLGADIDTDTFKVILEGVTVGITYSLYDAMCLFVATFYVFDVKYPKGLEKSLDFYHTYLLQLPNSRVKAAVRRLAVKIRK